MRLAVLFLMITAFLGQPAYADDPHIVAKDDKDLTTVNSDYNKQDAPIRPVQQSSNKPDYPIIRHFVVGACGERGDAISCVITHCPDGQRRYLQRTERVTGPGAEPIVSFQETCNAPATVDVAQLAIQEFYRTKMVIPAPLVHPGGNTLVNFPNVYASTMRSFEKPTTITAASVRLEFTPISYLWAFGDGHTETTGTPGKPYDPALTDRVDHIEKQYPVTHRYTTVGTFQTTLTITFDGSYSINGGPWQPIPGTLQATSPPQPISVAQAHAELVNAPH